MQNLNLMRKSVENTRGVFPVSMTSYFSPDDSTPTVVAEDQNAVGNDNDNGESKISQRVASPPDVSPTELSDTAWGTRHGIGNEDDPQASDRRISQPKKQKLYVLNSGGDGSASSFVVRDDCSLQYVTTVELYTNEDIRAETRTSFQPPSGLHSATEIRFNPNGTKLVVSVKGKDVGYFLVFDDSMEEDGDSIEVTKSMSVGKKPSGFDFDSNGNVLVSEFGASVSTYKLDRQTNILSPISYSIMNGQALSNRLQYSDKCAFVSNYASDSVSTYIVLEDTSEVQLMMEDAGYEINGPVDMVIIDRFLYVLSAGYNDDADGQWISPAIHVFQMNDQVCSLFLKQVITDGLTKAEPNRNLALWGSREVGQGTDAPPEIPPMVSMDGTSPEIPPPQHQGMPPPGAVPPSGSNSGGGSGRPQVAAPSTEIPPTQVVSQPGNIPLLEAVEPDPSEIPPTENNFGTEIPPAQVAPGNIPPLEAVPSDDTESGPSEIPPTEEDDFNDSESPEADPPGLSQSDWADWLEGDKTDWTESLEGEESDWKWWDGEGDGSRPEIPDPLIEQDPSLPEGEVDNPVAAADNPVAEADWEDRMRGEPSTRPNQQREPGGWGNLLGDTPTDVLPPETPSPEEEQRQPGGWGDRLSGNSSQPNIQEDPTVEDNEVPPEQQPSGGWGGRLEGDLPQPFVQEDPTEVPEEVPPENPPPQQRPGWEGWNGWDQPEPIIQEDPSLEEDDPEPKVPPPGTLNQDDQLPEGAFEIIDSYDSMVEFELWQIWDYDDVPLIAIQYVDYVEGTSCALNANVAYSSPTPTYMAHCECGSTSVTIYVYGTTDDIGQYRGLECTTHNGLADVLVYDIRVPCEHQCSSVVGLAAI